MKRKYIMEIVGNDIFVYTDVIEATDFKEAVHTAEQVLKSLEGRTIEQIRIRNIREKFFGENR